MHYAYLALAILFEAGWAIAMKLSAGLTRPAATIATAVFYLLSLVFLALATKKLELGAAYAVWAGAGASIIAIVGVLYFKEPMTALKAGSLALIVAGIVGLQFAGGGHSAAGP